jgi:predicted O-linked N-acetylglucosamine transferase (SPINDLY family)/predicted SAM-dependent methyltransferase
MPTENTDRREPGRWSWNRLKRVFAPAADDADALYAQGLAAEREGRIEQAIERYEAAVALQPGNAGFHYALAAVLRRTQRNKAAADAYRAGIALKPDDARMRADLGGLLIGMGLLEEARAEIEQARNLAPDLAEAHHNLGLLNHQLGLMDAAIAEIGLAAQLAPEDLEIRSTLLFILNYSTRHTPAEILAEHRRFGERVVQPVAAPRPEPAWPRRLRIGYVSPDFRSHVVTSFMLPLFAQHDRERFEVVGYYTYPKADEATAAMRALADDWLDCAQLSDAALAAQIRADRIDILVDLAGHTTNSRLRAFALRPAPLQLTYLGYPNTTGLSAIDFRITDAKADPPGESDRLNVERLARLPQTFLCYRPGPDIHETGLPPALQAGTVIFGCFNNFQKQSDPFFDAAARVLAAVPRSRLLLKAKSLGNASAAQRVKQKFAACGIDPSRLVLLGWAAATEDHLATYQRVDIALDSFPYNGTTTTCEALWMGVPVVALQGDRHAGRVGASLLATVGLPELTGRNVDEYVQIATRLAGDLPRLAELRAGMRARMRASALMDERGFVRDLEACYLEMWREKLAAGSGPATGAAAARALYDKAEPPAAVIDAIGRALAQEGDSAALQYLLGCVLEDVGRGGEAQAAYRKALELDPGHAKAANNLGCLQELSGQLDEAAKSYGRALQADPKLANALYNRANLEKQRGRFKAAEGDLRQALALEPRADWHSNLGEVLLQQWRLDEAEASQRAALALEPDSARAWFGLGNTLMLLSRADEAEAAFRRAIEIDPDLAEAHGNLLLCLHYRKGDDATLLYGEHLAWARRHADGLRQPAGFAAIDRRPGRRLNIGYLSPNFHRHSVASFFEPLLAAHDRTHFRVYCYSSVERPDEVTARLRGLSDAWRDLRGTTGDAAARLIREDRIDILVDLAGHTGGGRPLVFARKPAPVQIAWLGYPNTTGLAEMDYRLTDAVADPPGKAGQPGDTDRRHTEKLLRLPQGFLCFMPDPASPEPGALPALAAGHVTFGCFNNFAKITPEMIAVWSRLLEAAPRARLLLKAHALGNASARRGVLERFASHGVPAERLTLHGPEDSIEGHLARYRDVDIALDSFPYNGTTTTCEALWMGVPVVTLAGKTHVTRTGASILKQLGHDEWVATTPDEYLAKALALSADLEKLRGVRQGLRQRMRASPLLDGAGFAREVEAACRKAWSGWLASAALAGTLRLHIGGTEKKEGWKILNIQPGPNVDFVGDCSDLGQFADASVDELYASHVLEHLGHQSELARALQGFHRILKPGGKAMISVPDFEILCRLFLDPRATTLDRFHVMRFVFGGQMDEHDFHRVGLTHEFLLQLLLQAGFSRVERASEFGLFQDTSATEYLNQKISLNVVAYK